MTIAANTARPRFQSLGRWAAAILVVLILAVLIIRLLLGAVAEKRFDALIDAAKANGEPTIPADLSSPSIPPEQDAAVLLRRAFAAYKIPDEQKARDDELDLIEADSRTMWSEDRLKWFQQVLPANQKVLDLVHQARALPDADWKVKFIAWPVSLPDEKAPFRPVGNLLSAAAILDARDGKIALAMERLLDLLAYARHIDRHNLLYPHLVATGVDNVAAATVLQIAQRPFQLRPGEHGQYAQLLSALLDDSVRAAAADKALVGERTLGVDFITTVANRGGLMIIVRPIVMNDAARAFRNYDSARRATTAPSWPAARAAVPPSDSAATETSWKAFSRIMSRLATSGFDGLVDGLFRSQTERRAAAVSLAIARYRADHNDLFPAALADLVPDYLPAIPLDPMAPDNRPLAYVTKNGQPILYSVGTNGSDDAGDDIIPPKGGRNEWQSKDRVYPLTTQPAKP